MRWRRGGDDRKRTSEETAAEPVAPARHDVEHPGADDTATPAITDDGFDRPVEPVAERPDVPVDIAVLDEDELARARRRAVARALAEDLGDRGDVTSLATIPPGTSGRAQLVARADGVIAGLDLVREAFAQVDARVDVSLAAADGDRVQRGDVLGEVSGPLRSILTAERTALNFLTHLSGIATRTRQLVDAVAGTGCHVRDTRKTIPGLRLLEKHAVKVGGGANHRVGLHDALLVKDNHVAAAGGVTAAVEAALARADGLHVQVEVASLDELEEALAAGATDILLDNFTPEECRQALHRVAGRASLEASGTITLETVRRYAETGVHRVAVGSITHSAPALDIALDVTTDEIATPDHTGRVAAVWGASVTEAVSDGPADADDVAVDATSDVGGEAPVEADVEDTSDTEAEGAGISDTEAEGEVVVEPVGEDGGDVHAEADVEERAPEEPDAEEAAADVHEGSAAEDAGEPDEDDAVDAGSHAEDDAEDAEDEDAEDEDEEPAGLFAWRDRQVQAAREDD